MEACRGTVTLPWLDLAMWSHDDDLNGAKMCEVHLCCGYTMRKILCLLHFDIL